MPELPDLEIIREALAPRLVGVQIDAAELRRPLVVRTLVEGDAGGVLSGKTFSGVRRYGKFLLLDLDEMLTLAINPMLAGRLRYGPPLKRDRSRDVLVLSLADGNELRYHDAKDMGRLYLTRDLKQVPDWSTQGPDALDPELTLELFQQRLRRHQGEVKRVLTKQAFVAGIGNAYADEICWWAGIYPFRRRPSLSQAEIERLYEGMRSVLQSAIATLRMRIIDAAPDLPALDEEIRDFLSVHGKPGQPCPRCGATISEVMWERRATHFCRTCQPGLLIRN